jgi:cytidylate kinase
MRRVAPYLLVIALLASSVAEARRPVTIAIDGPSGVGKSSTAKAVARRLGYTFVDTGACYRALALQAKRRGVDWNDAKGLTKLAKNLPIAFSFKGDAHRVKLAGRDVSDAIRAPEISRGASIVAGHPRVRSLLVSLQRRLAGRGGAVLEGRDIGTNVFPEAQVKIFLTAAPEERARRHQSFLRSRGQEVPFTQILKQIKERDRRDRTREHAPLVQARDAVKLDSTRINLEQVVDRIVKVAQDRM